MTKLWARLYLWWNGWCVKHVKYKSEVFEDGSFSTKVCPDCYVALTGAQMRKELQGREKICSKHQRINSAVKLLRGKQG